MSDRRIQRPGVTHAQLPPEVFRGTDGQVLSDADCPPGQRGGGRREPVVRAEDHVQRLQDALGMTGPIDPRTGKPKPNDRMFGPQTAEALRQAREAGPLSKEVEDSLKKLREALGDRRVDNLEAQRPTHSSCKIGEDASFRQITPDFMQQFAMNAPPKFPLGGPIPSPTAPAQAPAPVPESPQVSKVSPLPQQPTYMDMNFG